MAPTKADFRRPICFQRVIVFFGFGPACYSWRLQVSRLSDDELRCALPSNRIVWRDVANAATEAG